MEAWGKAAAAALPALLIAAILFHLLRLRARRRGSATPPGAATLQEGIARLNSSSCSSSCIPPGLRFHSLDKPLPGDAAGRRRPHQEQAVFSWEDHPLLAAEAAVGGWSKFTFSSSSPGPVEVGWERPRGSSGFMQAVLLRSARPEPRERRSPAPEANPVEPGRCGSALMDLPLPGPAVEGASFPREAYWEVTVLYVEGRRQRRSWSKARPMDRLRQIFPAGRADDPQGEPDRAEEDEGVVALGLSRGGCEDVSCLPGSFSGSIGFFSNGSVLLDGTKLVSETSKHHWGATNKVIGCGFNPRKKKVIFTLDSELIHAVHCSSAAFAQPLFPTIAADTDIMVLVNLGQKPFAYKPANAWRSANPCLSMDDTQSAGENDTIGNMSQELFSIGRADVWWRERGEARKNNNGITIVNDNGGDTNNGERGSTRSLTTKGLVDSESVVVDIDAESDLFEIDIVEAN